jgi:signal transduction histidine kinase
LVPLDIRTLVCILGLSLLCQVLAIGLQYRLSRSYPGIGWWLLGSASMAVGFAAMGLAGPDHPFPLILVDNPLVVLGHLFLFFAVRDFTGLGAGKGRWFGFYVLFLAAYEYFLNGRHDPAGWSLAVFAALTVLTLLTAFRLVAGQGWRLPAATFTALPFLFTGTYLAVRLLATLARPPRQVSGPLAPQAFVIPIVTSYLWTYGFILMINQRAEKERSELMLRQHRMKKAESLGRMAGAVAHHLNNRLQAILGNLDRIDHLPPEASPAPELARVRNAAGRAAEISQQMLAYLGQIPREQSSVRLSDLVREEAEGFRRDLPAGLALDLDLPDPGPVLLADPLQLRQILGNLLENAKEALRDGRGRIGVRVRICPDTELPTAHRVPLDWQPTGTRCANLEVCDTGPGIAEEALDSLFDPFFTTRFTGRGLGLSAVLGYVQAHGGAVSVESRPGTGTCFRVHLPI